MKLFNKFRKQIIGNNKIRNYIFYAIGEIVLVVLGILIAVKINNLNEEQKQAELRDSILEEMQLNLKEDIEDMTANEEIHLRAINSAEVILKAFDEKIPVSDSMYFHFGKVIVTPQFLPTKSAYNNLVDVGVRILENDSLRGQLTELYENHYVFLKRLADSEWDTSIEDYNTIYREKFSKSEYRYLPKMIPENYKDLQSDAYYQNYLHNRIGLLKLLIEEYALNVERSQKLISHIEEELARGN